jgi:hypothetical protein
MVMPLGLAMVVVMVGVLVAGGREVGDFGNTL